jgi:hypothetical protein
LWGEKIVGKIKKESAKRTEQLGFAKAAFFAKKPPDRAGLRSTFLGAPKSLRISTSPLSW